VLSDDNAGPYTNENISQGLYAITFKANPATSAAQATPPPHAAGARQRHTAEGALLILGQRSSARSAPPAPGGDKDAVRAQAGIDRTPGLN
jgi:hypothetical protein